MDAGVWVSIVLGLGVGGHAVVGVVLTLLPVQTRPLWSRFGRLPRLLRLNGILLVVASGLHLIASWLKVADQTGAVFWSSIAPFPFFVVAGGLEIPGRLGRGAAVHHAAMALGWLTFAWHGTVVAGG